MDIKKFDQWNEVKKRTNIIERRLKLKPRDIFWLKIGQNIGNEEYGKGKDFVRPVVIIRQLTSDLFAPADKLGHPAEVSSDSL